MKTTLIPSLLFATFIGCSSLEAPCSGDECGDPDTSTSSGGGGSSEANVCEIGGTFGVRLRYDIRWNPTFAIVEGSGPFELWFRLDRTQETDTQFTDVGTVCGIDFPPLKTVDLIVEPSRTIGIDFAPARLFDPESVFPQITVQGTISDTTPSATISLGAVAFVGGLELPDPTAVWTDNIANPADHDGDTSFGITATNKEGTVPGGGGERYASAYTFGIPDGIVDVSELHMAVRQVASLRGQFSSCNRAAGELTIPRIGDDFAVNATIGGCKLADGRNCSPDQAAFDNDQVPSFEPVNPNRHGSFEMVRIDPSATCADIRAKLDSGG